MVVYFHMAERFVRGARSVFAGIENQAKLMPTALDQFSTMVSLARHLDDQGKPPGWRENSQAQLARLAGRVIISPPAEIREVDRALDAMLDSPDKQEKRLGIALQNEFSRARKELAV